MRWPRHILKLTKQCYLMKNWKIELKWALIFSGMSLLWMLIERLGGFHDVRIEQHPIFTNFIAIPAILVYVFALRDKKKNFYQGQMSYKQGIGSGLVISLIVAALSPLAMLISIKLITPHFFENAIAFAVSHGYSTQSEAEAYFNLQSYIIQGLIGAPIMGLITSAIVAIFVRSKQ